VGKTASSGLTSAWLGHAGWGRGARRRDLLKRRYRINHLASGVPGRRFYIPFELASRKIAGGLVSCAGVLKRRISIRHGCLRSPSLLVNFSFKWHRAGGRSGPGGPSHWTDTLFSLATSTDRITIIASVSPSCSTSVRKALTSYRPKFRIQSLLLSGFIVSGRINQLPLVSQIIRMGGAPQKVFHITLHSPRSKQHHWRE
jgi:hypothetical protein